MSAYNKSCGGGGARDPQRINLARIEHKEIQLHCTSNEARGATSLRCVYSLRSLQQSLSRFAIESVPLQIKLVNKRKSTRESAPHTTYTYTQYIQYTVHIHTLHSHTHSHTRTTRGGERRRGRRLLVFCRIVNRYAKGVGRFSEYNFITHIYIQCSRLQQQY